MSNRMEGRRTTQRDGGHRPGRARTVTLAGLLAAAVALVSAPAGAAEQGAPSGPQERDLAKRVSPYARYIREHALSVSSKPNRIGPSYSQGRAHRGNARYKP